jgi:hypothetical protein
VATLAWNALDQLPVEVLRAVRAEIEATDVGPPTGFAALRPAGGARPGGRAGSGGFAVPGSTPGTYDLGGGGGGMESAVARNASGAPNLKATVLRRLGPQ